MATCALQGTSALFALSLSAFVNAEALTLTENIQCNQHDLRGL